MYPYVDIFEKMLSTIAPYMAGTVSQRKSEFGEDWLQRFDDTLQRMFSDDENKLGKAIRGYVRFSLDATRLQKRFEKERKYPPKTYKEAAEAVYHNREYMHSLYLPGILLSHYLWPHHYTQLVWFYKYFKPYVIETHDRNFCDIGTGTGFYSRQMLSLHKDVQGVAFDISDNSLEYSAGQIEAFGFSSRWRQEKRDVVASPVKKDWSFLVSVEVLEHLENPLEFLKHIRPMLRNGGYGFITAAINAPNEDHIYLYRNCREVIDQLNEAGFIVIKHLDKRAFEPKADEPVPALGAFIVT